MGQMFSIGLVQQLQSRGPSGQQVLCVLERPGAGAGPIAHAVVPPSALAEGVVEAVVHRWHEGLGTGLLRPRPGQWLREAGQGHPFG